MVPNNAFPVEKLCLSCISARLIVPNNAVPPWTPATNRYREHEFPPFCTGDPCAMYILEDLCHLLVNPYRSSDSKKSAELWEHRTPSPEKVAFSEVSTAVSWWEISTSQRFLKIWTAMHSWDLAHKGEQRVGQSAAQNQGEAEQSCGRTEWCPMTCFAENALKKGSRCVNATFLHISCWRWNDRTTVAASYPLQIVQIDVEEISSQKRLRKL